MQIACLTCQTTRVVPDGFLEERFQARLSWLPGYTDEAGIWNPCPNYTLGSACVDGHTCENGHWFYLIYEKGKAPRYSLTRE
ncbi:hypothetical protein [Spirosoma agri]|uniref:Uncharacterized protein n=1 Tax=Spirosoma agri TaxID=1987381 RepID=A0A6M0IPZ5_9BACT|nr:hypothetical protein [Spirosoma agri]NEU70338.1 hypothetical protein [Spirosoma agri]